MRSSLLVKSIVVLVILSARPMVAHADDTENRAKQPSELLRVANVLGMKVRNLQQKELGHIDDLVIGLADGRLRYAALSDGGLLGFADKLFAVPWDGILLELNNRAPYAVVGMSEKEFAETPGFDKDDWPKHGDARWSKKSKREVTDRRETNSRGVADTSTQRVAPSKHDLAWRFTMFRDLSVKGVDGMPIGRIKDVIVDRDGTARYAGLACDASLGIDRGLLAIPWDLLVLTNAADGPAATLRLDAKRLLDAPELPADTNPRIAGRPLFDAAQKLYAASSPTSSPVGK